MKFVLTALLLALAGCTAGKQDSDNGSSERLRDLLPGTSIVYSANLDGEIEPCGCRGNPTGGIERRWNVLAEKVQGPRLMIDSGDLFYKSEPVPPFLEKQWNYQAEVLLDAYNAYGVEVMTPGELDFAAGVEQFEKLRSRAKFKIISANLYRRGSNERLLEPYVILTKNNVKVGLFGVYDETLALPADLEARPHLEAAREMVRELRGKVDVLIALTHIGLEKDQELAKELPKIDAIFGAHTQSFLIKPERVGDTLIFQPSFRGQHLGVYANGENLMHQIDTRYDSRSDKLNPMDKLLSHAKAEIARINREGEAELMGDSMPAQKKAVTQFQTFPRCVECHAAQYDFHKKTPHFRAFETLVKAKQSGNLECLKCHTVGAQRPGGWSHVTKLVQNAAGKSIDAESFAKSLPKASHDTILKTGKAFINVQCENCHGAAGEHPFSGSYPKQVSTTTCLQCHTPDQAPGWYKDGKPNLETINAKLKSMSCPRAN